MKYLKKYLIQIRRLLRRSTKIRRPPSSTEDYIYITDLNDPTPVEEAKKHPGWTRAMDEELEIIQKNKTWELVVPPPGKIPVTSKWVFRTKLRADGKVEKLKARLAARGFQQKEGIDYQDTFVHQW